MPFLEIVKYELCWGHSELHFECFNFSTVRFFDWVYAIWILLVVTFFIWDVPATTGCWKPIKIYELILYSYEILWKKKDFISKNWFKEQKKKWFRIGGIHFDDSLGFLGAWSKINRQLLFEGGNWAWNHEDQGETLDQNHQICWLISS